MTMTTRLQAAVPYLICLAAAAVLWWLTGQITFDARPGQIGPTFWPRVAIGLMAAAAAVEAVRKLAALAPDRETKGIGEALEGGEEDDEADAPRVPALLYAGMALTLAYAVLVTTLGFVLSTFLYLAAFMYLGRLRDHAVVWTTAVVGTLVFALVFLKIVYVSLPRGTAPFDGVTELVLGLFRFI